jgi:hypothetical protein
MVELQRAMARDATLSPADRILAATTALYRGSTPEAE